MNKIQTIQKWSYLEEHPRLGLTSYDCFITDLISLGFTIENTTVTGSYDGMTTSVTIVCSHDPITHPELNKPLK